VAKVESVTVTEATLFEVMQDLLANRITEEDGWQRLVEEAHVIVRISSAAEVTADVWIEKVRQILRVLDAGEITIVDADKAIQREYTPAA
jgi:hypothetical protein